MTKTTTRRDGPGLRRLRANPAAEAIRQSILADQENGRAEALARIEAEKQEIALPAAFVLGKANATAQAAADGPHAIPAPQARANAERPVGGPRKASGKRAAILASAHSGVLPARPISAPQRTHGFAPSSPG
jgi:hypothetical protein